MHIESGKIQPESGKKISQVLGFICHCGALNALLGSVYMPQGLFHSVREVYACNFEQICDMHTVMSYD